MSSPSTAVPHAQPMRSSALSSSHSTSSFKVLSRPSPAINTTGLYQPVDLGRNESLNNSAATTQRSDIARLHAGDLVTSPTSDSAHQHPLHLGLTSPAESQQSSGVPGLSDSRGTTIDSISPTPVSTHRPSSRLSVNDSLPVRKEDAFRKEEELSEEDRDESTGSQTPRRRGSGTFGFGFSLARRPSDRLGEPRRCRTSGMRPYPVIHVQIVITDDSRPVDTASFHNQYDQRSGTPRRPSLLTQQILSSPAVPLACNTTASSSDRGDHGLIRRPSLKDRVKGSLLGSVTASRDFASAIVTGESSNQPSGTSASREVQLDARRERKGSSTTYMSSRPSLDLDEHLEELVDEGWPQGTRARPSGTRRKTYNEGSSHDDMRSSYTYGTSASGWDRSVTGLTTDDDEGV